MQTKFKIIVCVLLICLCVRIFAGCCANSDKDSCNYEWYIKIYMPDGCIEGPGKVMYANTAGLMAVEIDGIQYKVGTQNILVRKLPEP